MYEGDSVARQSFRQHAGSFFGGLLFCIITVFNQSTDPIYLLAGGTRLIDPRDDVASTPVRHDRCRDGNPPWW